MAQTFTFGTCDGWQIWHCGQSEAKKRAAILAGRAPYVLLRDHVPASEVVAWSDLAKVPRISKVIATQKPSYVERGFISR